jgi:hypothetical protein
MSSPYCQLTTNKAAFGKSIDLLVLQIDREAKMVGLTQFTFPDGDKLFGLPKYFEICPSTVREDPQTYYVTGMEAIQVRYCPIASTPRFKVFPAVSDPRDEVYPVSFEWIAAIAASNQKYKVFSAGVWGAMAKFMDTQEYAKLGNPAIKDPATVDAIIAKVKAALGGNELKPAPVNSFFVHPLGRLNPPMSLTPDQIMDAERVKRILSSDYFQIGSKRPSDSDEDAGSRATRAKFGFN